MKKIKQIFSLLGLLLMVTSGTLFAQVSGISYTLSPLVSQHYWDKELGIGKGYMAGAQLGFGFGQMLELKANYEQGLNLKRDFSNMGIDNYADGLISDEDIELHRWGGELKLNLGQRAVMPFLTLGTGVQTTKLKREEEADPTQQIYVNGGGGLQFTLGDRYTLTVSAAHNYINTDPYQIYLNDAERGALGLAGMEANSSTLKYWNAKASLLFYLGGRKPGEMSDMDKAFQERFSSGYNGLSLPIEVTAGNLDFSKNLPYADTKFTGVSTGFDFGQYVGLRAFYMRSMDDGYFSNFNRLALYGGEAKFKLSSGQGMYPLIILGGGVIDPLTRYTVDNVVNGVNDVDMKNTPFVSGGLGLNLPLSRFFKLTGYAKALMTSSDEYLENTASTESLSTSWMYGLSANFVIGKKVRNSEQEVTKVYDEKVMNALAIEKAKTEKMRAEYEAKIAELQEGIMADYAAGDDEAMIRKYRVKKSLQLERDQIKALQAKEEMQNAAARRNNDASQIGLTPTDIQRLVDEIKRSNDLTQESIKNAFEAQEMRRSIDNEQLQMRFENMQKNMDLINDRNQIQSEALRKEIERLRDINLRQERAGQSSNGNAGAGVSSDDIKDLKEELKKEIEFNMKKQALEEDEKKATAKAATNSYPFQVRNNSPSDDNPRALHYAESNIETGFLIHGKPKLLVGYRRLYQYKETNLFVFPEVVVGLGKPAIFGVFLNGMYRFNANENTKFQPYIGAGLGFMQVDKKGEKTSLKFKPNMLIGANLLKIKNGRLFADWSLRSGLKYHQLSLGYRMDIK